MPTRDDKTLLKKLAFGLQATLSAATLFVRHAFFVRPPKETTLKDRLAMFPTQGLDVEKPVRIYWNAQHVPFIEAETDDDAAYALGLVHAHLRLGQMEMGKRIVYGRISEIVGPAGNAIDHTLRVIDFPKSAQAIVDAMPPHSRRWLDRYIDGVNRYIETCEKLPHEFALLGLKRETWQAKDVFAIGRLAGSDYSWLIWNALLQYRESPEWESIWKTVLAAGSGRVYRRDDERYARAKELHRKSFQSEAEIAQDILNNLMGQFGKLGSNSVAIGPSRSKSGAPLIANDPHLGLSLPNLWLIVGIKSPSYHCIGMQAPALPVFCFGRNQNIAWGGTNLHAANSDLYDVSDLDASEFRWETATLKNRFWIPTKVKYRTTKYGPVISDAPYIQKVGSRKMAMKWIGHGLSDEVTAMLDVNRASNWYEFQQALRPFATPSQNMLYADIDGHIGKLTATHIPYRKEKEPGDIFADKNQFEKSWGKIIDCSGLPSSFIPKDGFLVTANDPVPEDTFAIGYFYSPPDRALRIKQVVRKHREWDKYNLRTLQQDVFSTSSLMLRDALLERMRELDVTDGDLVKTMQSWDGHYYADSRGALAYQAFIASLARALYGALNSGGELEALSHLPYFEDLLLVKMRSADEQTLKNVFPRALQEAAALMGRFHTWGDVHRLEIKHVLSAIPVIGGRYIYDNLPVGGSRETVMKTAHGIISDKPEGAYFGAQARHISDLADADANYFALMGGQDGWHGSSTFMDQVDLWRRGEYFQMPMDMLKVRESFEHRVELTPAG